MDNKNFIGVGGLVVLNDRYLLVKHTYGEYKGLWILPGGHVEAAEHIDEAVEREVFEETTIKAFAKQIVSVRSRVRSENCTDCYIVFQMEYVSGTPLSDNNENDAARFFSIEEINCLENIVVLARIIINSHHKKSLSNIPRNIEITPYKNDNKILKLFI